MLLLFKLGSKFWFWTVDSVLFVLRGFLILNSEKNYCFWFCFIGFFYYLNLIDEIYFYYLICRF